MPNKTLGDRAVNGDAVGIKGFMAIGFPNLNPESKEYQDLVSACWAVKRIAPTKGVSVGYSMGRVIGIKADAGDKGLTFRISPEASGNYYAHAEVLCAKALYEHNPASTGTMYGSETEPYPVEFIEGYLGHAMVSPVQELTLADGTPESRDQYADGSNSCTDAYTQRLITQAVVV